MVHITSGGAIKSGKASLPSERKKGPCWVFVELTDSLLVLAVPDVNESITTACGESANGVEGDAIDRPHRVHTIDWGSVALERVLTVLLVCVEVIDRYSAFNRSRGKS